MSPASQPTDLPEYATRRRDVERLFEQTARPLSSALQEQAHEVASRVFGLGGEALRPVRPGDSLGPYRIERLLGLGGQAYVYAARHHHLDRRVALKVPRAEVAERLLKEARLAARLEHPRIVRVEAVEEADVHGATVPYLVMELCGGGSLDELLERHPEGLPLERVREVSAAILQALGFAHRQGVVHRDVKPGNVLLDDHGQVKLADLGIGKLSADDAGLQQSIALTGVSREGVVVGTPLFMAPEQLEPARLRGASIDGRADLFSFGKLLFVMLTGATPSTIRPPSRLRPGLDPAWDDLVFGLVEEDRERRFADADAVLAALAAVPEPRPAPPVEVVVTPRAATSEAPALPAPPARADPPPAVRIRPRGGRLARGAFLLLALLSGGLSGFLIYRGTQLADVANVVHQHAWWCSFRMTGRALAFEWGLLAAGALIGGLLVSWFRRAVGRAGRDPGLIGALALGLPFVAWPAALFAGRAGLVRPLEEAVSVTVSHAEFMALVVASGALSLFLGPVVAWALGRPRHAPSEPEPAAPTRPEPTVRARPRRRRRAGGGGVVLRILGVITGLLTLSGALLLAVAGVVLLIVAASFRGCAQAMGASVPGGVVDPAAATLWSAGVGGGVVLGLVLVVACLVGLFRRPRRRSPRALPED